METILWFELVSNLIIKIFMIILLMVWVITPIYALRIDNKKKKELLRLRQLNDNLEKIYEVPIKKAKEILSAGRVEG